MVRQKQVLGKYSLKAYVVAPTGATSRLTKVLKTAAAELKPDIEFTWTELGGPKETEGAQLRSLAAADFVLADVSEPNPNMFFEIGMAQAAGKSVIFLVKRGESPPPFPQMPISGVMLQYDSDARGLSELSRRLAKYITQLATSPRPLAGQGVLGSFLVPPYMVDLNKLAPAEFDNLCFELFTQMGYRTIEWGKELREIDLVATLPKKDPDGYEYQELWLISTGRRAPLDFVVETATEDPTYFVNRIIQNVSRYEDIFAKYRIRPELPITVLFVVRSDGPIREQIERSLGQIERRWRARGAATVPRVRVWDSTHLTSLIQQYPQIAYKYFSDDRRVRSQYRKTYEDLYRENVEMTESLQATKAALQEEKKKRFVAERDSAWKDVAFKAAHKLGNPIDAVDNFLLSLRKRLEEKRLDEALEIARHMDISIEEAKVVVSQFKSISKSQQISPREVDLAKVVEHACRVADGKGVEVSIVTREATPEAMVDPDRMAEVFSELVANSLHWLDKQDKKISVQLSPVAKKDLPEQLSADERYLRVVFADNGPGIPLENKEKIFAPFFTTYPQGTGLGLSMVRWTVEAHGGRIVEEGKPGEGAVFNMLLPAAKTRKKGV